VKRKKSGERRVVSSTLLSKEIGLKDHVAGLDLISIHRKERVSAWR
jgi:hypothetical protein